MMPQMASGDSNILASSILLAPAAPAEFTSLGYRFEHHSSGNSYGTVILSHPGCPRLSVAYGTRDCFTLAQAVELILFVYRKEYQFR
jgi:hypothetical protein